MSLLDKLLGRKVAKQSQGEKSKQSFVELHPEGLSMSHLEALDYEKFGAVLKQQKLLHPSYNQKPANTEIFVGQDGHPRVKLYFGSIGSPFYKVIIISGYKVSYSTQMPHGVQHSEEMSNAWVKFVEKMSKRLPNDYSYSIQARA